MGARTGQTGASRTGALAAGGQGSREAAVWNVLSCDGTVQRGPHHHAKVSLLRNAKTNASLNAEVCEILSS